MNLQKQKAQVLDFVGELAKAPQNAETIAAEFLMLRLQGQDFDQLPDGLRKVLLAILPQASATEGQPSVSMPTKRSQFSEVYSGEHCKLEVKSSGRLGREVRLTINAGSSLEKAFDEINQKSQEKYGRDAIYRGTLYNDEGVKEVLKETKVITFTPVVKNSSNKAKFGDTSQDALLKENGMDWVDRPYITAATGAFRVGKGFPKDADNIGSTTDKGDLLKGLVARARSGAVGSYDLGVFGHYYDGHRFDDVVAAGSSPSN